MVLPGLTTKLRFRVPRGVRCKIRVPPIPRDNYFFRETWTDESDETVFERCSYCGRTKRASKQSRVVPPGRYTIEVRDASGAMAKSTIVVSEQPGSKRVFDLPLPGSR